MKWTKVAVLFVVALLAATSGFAQTTHNFSKTVWGTSIQPDGRFKNVYYWSEGTGLKPFD